MATFNSHHRAYSEDNGIIIFPALGRMLFDNLQPASLGLTLPRGSSASATRPVGIGNQSFPMALV